MPSTAIRVRDIAARWWSPSAVKISQLSRADGAHSALGCTMQDRGRATTAWPCNARARAAGVPPVAAASIAVTSCRPS